MKKITHSILTLLFIFSFNYQANAQIFGNTVHDGYGSYGNNQIVWIKFVTGASDGGSFTDFGVYDHPTSGSTCAMKFALYSHDAATDKPANLLVQEYIASPTNGQWNEFPIDPTEPITASTTYWIGLRFTCSYGSAREVGVNWAEPPLRYKASWSFNSAWPDPPGTVSTQSNLNNVALYVVGNNETLPVEMLSFDVDQEDRKAILNWATATEINNSGWNIQRSDNGFTWNTIDWVEGNLDSSNKNSYSYTDKILRDGLTFYRLEQVDIDGKTSYSEVRNVEYITDHISISPNPARDHLYIRGIEDEVQYQLHDAEGKLLNSSIVKPGEPIEVDHLMTGNYFLALGTKTYRFIKQ